MIENQTTSDPTVAGSLPDRIQLNCQYDVETLQREVFEIVSTLTQRDYIYYSAIPIVRNVKEPSVHDWSLESMLKGCPYLTDLARNLKTEISSIRLMRLEAGAELKEHTDPTLDAAHREIVRLTLPVFSDDSVIFLLNGTEVPMKPGELWYMKLSDRHSVHNNSFNERINISIDVIWNEWIERWLASSMS